MPKHKGCPHPYGSNPGEEEDAEEVMAAICHSGEAYSSTQGNR